MNLVWARLVISYSLLELCNLFVLLLLDSDLLVPFLLGHVFVFLPLVHQGKVVLYEFCEVALELLRRIERQFIFLIWTVLEELLKLRWVFNFVLGNWLFLGVAAEAFAASLHHIGGLTALSWQWPGWITTWGNRASPMATTLLKWLGLSSLTSPLQLFGLLRLQPFFDIFWAQIVQEFFITVISCQILELFVYFARDGRAVVVDIT